MLTLTPYDFWRHTHGIHHATSGNLDRRGIGDVDTLTVREYLALPRWRQLAYRLYRNPIVMFEVGPIYLFFLRHRLPLGLMRQGWAPWISTMATNGAIALIVGGMMWWIGVWPFLLLHLPIALIAGAIGVWLFYVQHQFEHTVWSDNGNWNLPIAALHGSSHYDLPAVLRWFTANIGVHHIHHLCSRIPSTGCRWRCVSIPISPMSAGSRWGRVWHACASCCGMKPHGGSLRFASCATGVAWRRSSRPDPAL